MSDVEFTAYKIEVRPLTVEEGGGYLASIPELPGCQGDGATVLEAFEDLQGAFSAWTHTARELGREVPAPASGPGKPAAALVRFPRSLHQALTRLADAEGVSFNQMTVSLLSCALGARTTSGAFSWAAYALNSSQTGQSQTVVTQGLYGLTEAITRAQAGIGDIATAVFRASTAALHHGSTTHQGGTEAWQLIQRAKVSSAVPSI